MRDGTGQSGVQVAWKDGPGVERDAGDIGSRTGRKRCSGDPGDVGKADRHDMAWPDRCDGAACGGRGGHGP
jgi:hypothetical protein